MKKIITCFFLIVVFFGYIKAADVFDSTNSVFSSDSTSLDSVQDITQSAAKTYNLDEYINTINSSVRENIGEDFNFKNMANEIINKNNINYKKIFMKLLDLFFKEISSAIKGAITIFIVVVIMAVLSNLELEKKSEITKIAHLACFIVIATITIATFVDTVKMLTNVVHTQTTLMQVISPFLLAVLIATGKITTTGIIQPLLLFLASFVGGVITYFVIPLLSISVAFNVICSISENIKLEKMSKIFSSVSLWTVGVVLTVFLGVLSLETSLSTSVDTLGVKTTQAAVSNFVPVVGKFFSDSLEVVVGATKIIGKTGGVIGIIGIIIVAIVPIFKLASIMGIYMLLAALVEPISNDELTSKYLSSIANTYKTMLGVLIGITILFVISTGIILNLVSTLSAWSPRVSFVKNAVCIFYIPFRGIHIV